MSVVGQIYVTESSLGPSYHSSWANTTFTLSIGASSSVVFKLLDENGNLSIPSGSSNVEKGELYYVTDSGGTTGTVHIKLS